jgi:hypothetical protein
MPLPCKLRTLTKLAAAAGASLALLALPGTAAAASVCPVQVTAPVFAQFGDPRDYYLAPGGSFEGSVSWAKSGGVSLVAGNEPWFLAGAGHTTAVRLTQGGTITSAKLCVTAAEPYLRFVAKATGYGSLVVSVTGKSGSGTKFTSATTSISAGAHRAWAPSRLVSLNTASYTSDDPGYVEITFRSQGDWVVDDVFVDPYRR